MSSDSDIEILDDEAEKRPKIAPLPTASGAREASVIAIDEPGPNHRDSIIIDESRTREDETDAALLDCIQITPEHIRANGTLHTTPFHGLAELIDNAVDSGAKTVRIQNHGTGSSRYITVTDDGEGMNRTEALRTILVGFSMKRGDVATIGQFGNGLKSGSIRLGETMLLATKKGVEYTVLMISLPYLEKTNNNKCYAPCISYRQEAPYGELKPLFREKLSKHEVAKKIILEYSPFQQENDLHQFLKDTLTGPSGTCIAIKNLKTLENGQDEMRPMGGDFVCIDRGVQLFPGLDAHSNSLSKFLQTLYLEPKIVIFIQDRHVRLLDVRRSLVSPRWKLLDPAGMQCFQDREQERIRKEAAKLENERASVQLKLQGVTAQIASERQYDKKKAAEERVLRMDLEKYDKQIAALQGRKIDKEQIGAQIRVYFGLDLIDRADPRMLFYSNGRRILKKSLLTVNGKPIKDGFKAVMGVVAIVDIPSTLLPTMQNRENFEIPGELDMIVKKMSAHARTFLDHADAVYKAAPFWCKFGYESDLVDIDSATIEVERTRKLIGEEIGWRMQCSICHQFREVQFSDITETLDKDPFECNDATYNGCCPKTREDLEKEEIKELDETVEPTYYSEGKYALTKKDIEEAKKAETAKKVTKFVIDQPLVRRKRPTLPSLSSNSSREQSLEKTGRGGGGGGGRWRASPAKSKKNVSFQEREESSDSDYSPPSARIRTRPSMDAKEFLDAKEREDRERKKKEKQKKMKKQRSGGGKKKEKPAGRKVRSEMGGVSLHVKSETEVEENEEEGSRGHSEQGGQEDDVPYTPLYDEDTQYNDQSMGDPLYNDCTMEQTMGQSMVVAKEENDPQAQQHPYTPHPSKKRKREEREAAERQRRREEAEYLAGERRRFGSLAPEGLESSDRGMATYTASSEALDMANMIKKEERKRKGDESALDALKKKRDDKDFAAPSESFDSTQVLIDDDVTMGSTIGAVNHSSYADVDESILNIYAGGFSMSSGPAYDGSVLGGMHDDLILANNALLQVDGAPTNGFMGREERLAALKAMSADELVEKHLGLQDALKERSAEVAKLKEDNEDLGVQIDSKEQVLNEKDNDIRRLERVIREKDEEIAKSRAEVASKDILIQAKDEEIARLRAGDQGTSSNDKDEEIAKLRKEVASKDILIDAKDALQSSYLNELANMKTHEIFKVMDKLKISSGANLAAIMNERRSNGAL